VCSSSYNTANKDDWIAPIDMSLPQTSVLYATSEKVFVPLSPAELAEMERLGLSHEKRRIYRMEYLSKVLEVECPVLCNKTADGTGILFSSAKLPTRPYPSHVYLLAMLLTFIGLSMRASAKRIQVLFGLSSFCHSTISRLADRLNNQLPLLTTWQPEALLSGDIARNELPQPRPNAWTQALKGTTASGPGHGLRAVLVHPKHWRKPRPGLVECLFRLFHPILQAPEYGNWLVYTFAQQFKRLLL